MVSGASDGDSVEDSRGDTSAESDDQPAQALSFIQELETNGFLPGHGILRMRGPDFSDSPPSARDKRLETLFSRGMDEDDASEGYTFGLSESQYEQTVKLQKYINLMQATADNYTLRQRNDMANAFKAVKAFYSYLPGPHSTRALLCGSVDMGRDFEIDVHRPHNFPFYTAVLEGDCNFLGSDEDNDELTVISSRTNLNPPDRSRRQVNRLNLRRVNEREREETENTQEVHVETEIEVKEDETGETVFELKNTPIPALFEIMKEYDTSRSEDSDSDCEELEID